ncbi:hypothetical protein HMI55_003067, partial [Coelomomyces lativittatus]
MQKYSAKKKKKKKKIKKSTLHLISLLSTCFYFLLPSKLELFKTFIFFLKFSFSLICLKMHLSPSLFFIFLVIHPLCVWTYYTSFHQKETCNEEIPAVSFVLWHGMGDNSCSQGMNTLKKLLETSVSCSFVHSIQIGKDIEEDQRASIFGDIKTQLETVCSSLSRIPQLKYGFNAIGFSQGGLFLRALVQQCTELNVHTLMTFGAPHQGITDLPPSFCSEHTIACNLLKRLIESAVYSQKVQHSIVQATYFK